MGAMYPMFDINVAKIRLLSMPLRLSFGRPAGSGRGVRKESFDVPL
jgi:hypothetical protein